MKHTVLFSALALAAVGAMAQEAVGTVVSSTPVIQQVTVPRTTCAPGVPQAQPATSGGGGIVGALTGAGIGSAIGAGTGNAVAIAGGALIGAMIGNNVESNNIRAQQAMVPNCMTENTVENRTVAYNVVYEFGGRQYSAQMPYDPGSTVRLNVAGATAPAAAVTGAVTAPPLQASGNPVAVSPTPVPMVQAQAPVAVAAAPVYVQPYPVYPAPAYAYPYPYYNPWPVGVSLGFVIGGGHRGHWGHGGGHWHR
jgi:uncharacterized protein YcfJ